MMHAKLCGCLQVLEKMATPRQLLRNWVVSFSGNLLGSVALVALVSTSGLMATTPGPANVAAAKTSLTFIQVMPALQSSQPFFDQLRAVLCTALLLVQPPVLFL